MFQSSRDTSEALTNETAEALSNHAKNAEILLDLLGNEDVMNGIIHEIANRFGDHTTNRLNLPPNITNNLDRFVPFMSMGASQPLQPLPRQPKPTLQSTSSSSSPPPPGLPKKASVTGTKENRNEGNVHARSLWKRLGKLERRDFKLDASVEALRTRSLKALLSQDGEEALELDMEDENMWLGLYRYMGKLGNQTKTNEIRQLIIRLTMRTVFRSLKPPRKGGKRSKTAPHLSDADLGRFCDDYFGFLVDDETAQGKAILKWIRHESRLANAYGVLADELGSVGRGTLVYMVANGWITHHQLGYGLALDTVVGKAGLAHLESLKLYEMKSVRDWEKRVERWCEKLLPALTGNEQQS